MPDNLFSFRGSEPTRRAEPRRINPGRLKRAREAKGLNQTELALRVKLTRQVISLYEQGSRTPDGHSMADLSGELDQPVSYFVSDDLPVFGASSVRFFRATGPKTKRRNLSCDALGEWLVQTAKYFDQFVNFPPVDVPALAPMEPSGRYTSEEIERAAEDCRARWGLGLGPISNVVALLENKGIVTCRYEMSGQRIEAFSFWNGDRPFVFMASDKDAACRSRFDVAHELGHLVLHRWVGPDELEDPKTLTLIEREADRFAGALLLPRKTFPTEIFTTRLDAFVSLKRRWKVSIQAMIYRCKNLGLYDDDQVTNLWKQVSARRWKSREPLDDVMEIPLEEPSLLKRAASLVLTRKTPDEIFGGIQNNRRNIEQFCNLDPGVLDPPKPTEFRPTLK